ncbi:Ig-like domain-containing protein [Roseivirga pacifica]|uniref:Ig-like domain-containing protein n=1 Tax=Roseivirga pacifica TaxID=1267423 RepID=UPI003BAE5435
MRKFILLTAFISLCLISYAQKLDWVLNDNLTGIVSLATTDNTGGVVYYREGNIVKSNSEGQIVFQKTITEEAINTGAYYRVFELLADDEGNVLIGGYVVGSLKITIDNEELVIDQEQFERKKGLILKLSNNGELVDHHLFDVQSNFSEALFSMDYYDNQLYMLYALVESLDDQGVFENELTEYIEILDSSWETVKSRSFSAQKEVHGLNNRFLMDKITVYDEGQIYLTGIIGNGIGSDLSEEIVTDNAFVTYSLIKLDSGLEFSWFRGVQGANVNLGNIGLFGNGDVVLNTVITGVPLVKLVGNEIETVVLANQDGVSTRQLFFESNGSFKFQTVLKGASPVIKPMLTDSENLYLPLSTYDSKELVLIDVEEEFELVAAGPSYPYQFHHGYLKLSKNGEYQSHRFYDLEGSDTFMDSQVLLPTGSCESFMYFARYGGNGSARVNLDFDSGSSHFVESASTYDYFIAHYSNEEARISLDSQGVSRSENDIIIPFTFYDESLADLTFEVESSDESIVSTENVIFNLSSENPNIVIHQVEGGSGNADVTIKIIDRCGSYSNITTSIDLTEINNAPVFTSEPVTTVNENGFYRYDIQTFDSDLDIIEIESKESLPEWLRLYRNSAFGSELVAGKANSEGRNDGSIDVATFSFPIDIVEDSQGNLFVVDSGFNGSVRKITIDGQVSTFVGRDDSLSPDGFGIEAGLNEPSAIAVDSHNNLYVTELAGKKVRKITPEGGVSTVAVFQNALNDIAINSRDEVFVVSSDEGIIYKIDDEGAITHFAGGGIGDGQAEEAGFVSPMVLAFDMSDNLFVGEKLADGIRKVSPTGLVSTVIQFGNQRSLKGIEVDARGSLYVSTGQRVFKYYDDGSEYLIARFGSDYRGIYLNEKQELLVSDFSKHNIVKWLALGGYELQGTADPSDGLVEVTLKANDGKGGVATQRFTIKVDNQSPVFNSPEDYQRSENHLITNPAYSVGVQDESEVTYSLGTDHDEALFNMNGQYINSVYFNESPDFETPQDADGDNVYVFEIIATDKGGNSSSLLVNLTVDNVNESEPIITSNGGGDVANVMVIENSTAVTKITATGLEDGFLAYFQKTGGADSHRFSINSSSGELSFWNFNPDFEFPVDSDKDNIYEVEITAHEGEFEDTQILRVEVLDVLESTAPNIISAPVTSVNEGEQYEYRLLAEDPDNEDFNIELVNGPDWLSLNKDVYQAITFAGTFNNNYENGHRLVAGFDEPRDIVHDSNGNLFVLDANKIRKIKPNGEVVAFVGTGGLGAQNGAGDQATFRFPSSMTIDSNDNIYITDSGNYLIRKISPSGEVTTLAGSGTSQYLDGNGTSASFVFPTGVTVDVDGNLYVTDHGDNRIRKITPDGTVSTLAGTGAPGLMNGSAGQAEFNGPTDISIDSEGNLYVAEYYNYVIRKITSLGEVSTFAGSGNSAMEDGRGIDASFKRLTSIYIDDNDDFFVSDGHAVRKVTFEGDVTTVIGSFTGDYKDGLGVEAQFRNPKGLTVQNENLYLADEGNDRIRKISKGAILNGMTSGVFGDFDIELKVSDEEDGFNTQNFTITVRDVTPPVFTSPTEVSFTENSNDIVNQVTVTDNSQITFTLYQSLDGPIFNLDQTGVLSFRNTPDFEVPRDLGFNNEYQITIEATDEYHNSSTHQVTITVEDVEEKPEFISDPIVEISQESESQYEYLAEIKNLNSGPIKIKADVLPGWLNADPVWQVSTLAGGKPAELVDGYLDQAMFNYPKGITSDAEGNLYVADSKNHAIRKISTDGVVSTFAGSGLAGYKDGARYEASFLYPGDIAFDSQGNLIVVDTDNHRIRMISKQGVVTTLAGSGEEGFMDGSGKNSRFSSPRDVAVDSQGNIFITDIGNLRIRKISPEGEVSTFAGSGNSENLNGAGIEASFQTMVGLAIDSEDNLYVGHDSSIKKVTKEGEVSTFVGSSTQGYLDGIGTSAQLLTARAITYGPDGHLYFADVFNHRIRKISMEGEVTTVAGSGQPGDDNGPALSAKLYGVTDLVFDNSGQLFFTEDLRWRIRKITTNGNIESFAGVSIFNADIKNGVGTDAVFESAKRSAFDSKGNLYVADQQVIRRISPSGLVSVGAARYQGSPYGIYIDENDVIYFTDVTGNGYSIQKFVSTSLFTTVVAGSTTGSTDGNGNQASFNAPYDIIGDSQGDLIVADTRNHRLRRVKESGDVTTFSGSAQGFQDGDITAALFNLPYALAKDDEDNIYVADQGNRRIRKISPSGQVSTFAGNGEKAVIDGNGTEASFQLLKDITIDDNGFLWVIDGNLIRKIAPDGMVITVSKNSNKTHGDGIIEVASFVDPTGIEFYDGTFYITDSEQATVRYMTPSGLLLSGNPANQVGQNSVSISVADAFGGSSSQDFAINITSGDAPLFTSGTSVNFEENSAEVVYTAIATDESEFTYSLSSDADGALFIIDENTGVLTFNEIPDFELPLDLNEDNDYHVNVLATDIYGNQSTLELTVSVEDIDDTGAEITLSSSYQNLVFTPSVTVNVSFSEEVTDDLSVEKFTVTNATITDFQGSGLAYSFVLNSLTDGPASVKLLENKVFDAAQNGNEASNVLTFNFEARNVAPTAITLSSASVIENASERVEIAILSAEDGDESDQHTFRLVAGEGDADNAKFNIIGNKLFKRSGVALDFESQETLSIRIQVSDIRGGSFAEVKTIDVIDLPEPSISIQIVNATERELEVSGINFGRVKIGNSVIRQIEIENTSSDAQIEVSEIKLTEGFTVAESSFNLEAGAKKSLDVTFTPLEIGVHLGRLEIVSNAGKQSLSIAGSAFANKKPIAIAPEVQVNHIPGNILKLIGFDPDGDEIEFEITEAPSLGSLEEQSGFGEYIFIPSGLAPETTYEDQLKFKVVETNGGLSSEETTLKFGFRIRDAKHTLLPTEIVSVDENNLNIVINFEDEVINNDYYLTGFYRGKEEGENKYFATRLKIGSNELTEQDGVLSAQIMVNKNDYPALFTNTKFLLAVKLQTANGFESSDARIFSRSSEGQLNANASHDGSTEDGDFSVFALDSTVPENETVSINISAIEFGDYDFAGATLKVTKSPENGILGGPVLVSNEDGLAQWTVDYTSTSEIGINDSFEFSVFHPNRDETLLGKANIEVIEVADAPELGEITDQQVNEDGTLSISIEASDLDSDLIYEVISSESDISGTVSEGKLNLIASNDFNGMSNIQLIVTEDTESDPQSVVQSFSLKVLAMNDAPIVTSIDDQAVDEDDQLSITLAATDVDEDATVFSYSVTSDKESQVTYNIQNGELVIVPVADFNGDVTFTVKADDGSGTATALSEAETFKLTVNPVNDAPEVVKAISTQALVEGFAAYNLDLSKFFTDKETSSSELTYNISNLTNVSTSVSGSVLTITSVSGNTGLQTAQITASDGELSVQQDIIFVTSAPSADITMANAVADQILDEDFGVKAIDLSDVFAYSLDDNAAFVYSLAGNQNVDAVINGTSLEITSTENFNGADVIYITATVDGKANLTSFNITVNPVNDSPELVAALNDASVLEDTPFTKVISENAFTDVDKDVLTYSAEFDVAWLSFDASSRTFSGNPENGDVGSVQVILTARDPSGANVSDEFTITVSNTNDAPSNITISADELDENVDQGTIVATLSSEDIDEGNDSFTYSLVSGEGDDDNDAFNIVNGKLVTASEFDFEAKESYSIRLRTNDGFEGTYDKVFAISVNNVNEVATDISLVTSSLAENQSVGTAIDAFSTTDPDASDTHTYVLVSGEGDTDNSSFEIADGQLVSKASFNFEEKSSYSVRIKSTDAGGLSVEKAFVITITDANDAPTAVTSATLEIAENEATGSAIGEFATLDEDEADSHSYSLIGGDGDEDNDKFMFEGATLKAKSSFNFEVKSLYNIRVRSTDGYGAAVEATFAVNVTNVLEVELSVPDNIDFQPVDVGETAFTELLISNDGEDELEITNVTFPEGFAGDFESATIPAGGNYSLAVSFSPLEAKLYNGQLTIESNDSTHTVSVTGEGQVVTSIDNTPDLKRLIKVYPNPTSSYIEVDLSYLNGIPANLSITTINGNTLWNKARVTEQKVKVDVSAYKGGTYLLLVGTEATNVVKKFIVNK